MATQPSQGPGAESPGLLAPLRSSLLADFPWLRVSRTDYIAGSLWSVVVSADAEAENWAVVAEVLPAGVVRMDDRATHALGGTVAGEHTVTYWSAE